MTGEAKPGTDRLGCETRSSAVNAAIRPGRSEVTNQAETLQLLFQTKRSHHGKTFPRFAFCSLKSMAWCTS